MQTVNFKCGHCGNLMGVSAEYLGRQVRCPHCQQVVVAPAAPQAPALEQTLPQIPVVAPSPHDETTLLPPPADDADSIFTEEGPTDDLFGDPKPPRLDVSGFRDSTLALEAPSVPPPTPALDSTLAFQPQLPTSAPPLPQGPASHPDMPDWMKTPLPAASAPSANGSSPDLPPPPPVKAPRRSSLGLLLFLTLVFMPLVLYSILATIVAILALSAHRAPPDKGDPREFLNDIEGDHPTPNKPKPTSRIRESTLQFATAPLPDHLRVKLGHTLDLDQLRVTPQSVERGTIEMTLARGGKPEIREVFILRLHLENVSKDTAFYPLDAFFNRHWNSRNEYVPLNVLFAGDNVRLIGGPANWERRSPQNKGERYHVHEYKTNTGTGWETELKPGGAMDGFVCTDGFDPEHDSPEMEAKFDELLSHEGTIVWHVQVRRGLTHWKDRDIPTTAVIGVEFTAAEVKRPN